MSKTVYSDKIHFEDTLVKKMYLNGALIYQNITKTPEKDYSKEYLTFEIISGGTFGFPNYNGYNFSYSIDNGTTWTTIPLGWSGIAVSEGDKIILKGNNQIIGGNLGWWSNTAEFVVYGNIMSIINSTGFTTANTVSNNAFKEFLYYCNGIVSAEHLVLPATILAESCYQSMFEGCSSLTTAPELPATTLTTTCYSSMFYNCSSLNYIKCLATDIPSSNCTIGWVNGVPSTGTFVKNASMSSWTTGQDGIPRGWTVIDAE